MRRELLIAEFLSTPWALMPERLAAFAMLLTQWQYDLPRAVSVEDIAAKNAAVAARRADAVRAGGGSIGVLPLYGVITQRGNMADDISGPGSVSTQRFAAAFRELMADQSIGAIVIDVDSPGGSVYGVQELAEEIAEARGQKPVVAIANSVAASAAYWIASQASELYITPSGEVGSIGVFGAHKDLSKAQEQAGVKTTLVSAGKFKTEGNPFEPMSQDARDYMQGRIDSYYGAFARGVAKGRNVPISSVRDGMGQGRTVNATQALEQKMVDGIATFGDVIQKVSRDLKQSRTAANRAGSLAAAKKDITELG